MTSPPPTSFLGHPKSQPFKLITCMGFKTEWASNLQLCLKQKLRASQSKTWTMPTPSLKTLREHLVNPTGFNATSVLQASLRSAPLAATYRRNTQGWVSLIISGSKDEIVIRSRDKPESLPRSCSIVTPHATGKMRSYLLKKSVMSFWIPEEKTSKMKTQKNRQTYGTKPSPSSLLTVFSKVKRLTPGFWTKYPALQLSERNLCF